MKCMMRIYIHRPVLVVDHLAVADLEPDERGQLHRLPKHLVVLPVVDQDLNTIMHVLIIHSAVYYVMGLALLWSAVSAPNLS
jgi:hypothetical protein